MALPQPLLRGIEVWRTAWHARGADDAATRRRHELEFLPAAEALRDSPAHPAPRTLLVVMLLLAACVLLWTLLGRMDVVSVAEGTIIASGRSHSIQPDATSVVKAIHVRDGQSVKAGQLLVELDPSVALADLRRLESDLLAARLDDARAEAMLAAIDQARPPLPATRWLDADAPTRAQLEDWLRARHDEFRSKLLESAAITAQRSADVTATRAMIASLEQSLPISEQQAEDYRHLVAGKYVAKHAWLERERLLLQQRQELAAQRARLLQAGAALDQARQQQSSVIAEMRRSMLDLRQSARQRVAALTEELGKARQRDRLTRLVAPVAGTVQELAVTAPGAVVTAAQVVMRVVPNDGPLEVEALLPNKDIGFVHAGQRAQVKVDAFDFTRFGMLPGQVSFISSDAIADPRHGPVYSVRIRLARPAASRHVPALPLQPGMTVRAEIRTGSRRVISYFLSPLQRRAEESLRER